MKYCLVLILSLLLIKPLNAAVKFNPMSGLWEGNICMNNIAWQFVNWQPLGSLCWIQLPGRPPTQGIIVNA